jgi:hypothetical protein
MMKTGEHFRRRAHSQAMLLQAMPLQAMPLQAAPLQALPLQGMLLGGLIPLGVFSVDIASRARRTVLDRIAQSMR